MSTVVCKTTTQLFRYGGYIGCYLILAGYDALGPHLVQVDAHGVAEYAPFLTMGSGSIYASAELESGYKEDLTIDEARDLAIKAIKAGITEDLGSGSNVDFCILTKGKSEHFRNFEIVGKKEIEKKTPYVFKRNNIKVLKEQKITFEKKSVKLNDNGMIIEG